MLRLKDQKFKSQINKIFIYFKTAEKLKCSINWNDRYTLTKIHIFLYIYGINM